MKRILMVDDSPSVITAAYDELEEKGYIVEVAYNGEEALDYLEENPEELPDLIIMDIQMPKLSGVETTRIIRDRPEWKHLPIIALTAKSPETVGDSLPLFDNYLVKPFGFNQMLELVQRMIGKPEEQA